MRSSLCLLRLVVTVLACVASGVALASGAEARLDAQRSLRLFEGRTTIIAQVVSPTKMAVRMDPTLLRAVTAADDYFVVGRRAIQEGRRIYLLLVTQTPSRENKSASYCGSGTEDVLRLVEWQERQKRLAERDSLLIQSCVNSLSLNDDTGMSLRKRLESIGEPEKLSLVWLEHPRFGSQPHTIVVHNGKLVIN